MEKMIMLRRLIRISPWVAAGLGLLLLAFSISNQSIDMDEAQTWDYTRLQTLGEVWAELREDTNSESQMPLGMVALWGWARLFGTGEVATRSLNLLWAAVALGALARVGAQTRIPWLPVLFAIQPFVWYSMDQARTPVMQMAGGALLLAGSLELLQNVPRWRLAAILIAVGAIILCGASMLGAVPLAVTGGFLAGYAAWKRITLPRGSKMILFAASGILLVLGVYYISTLLRGAGGMKLWAVTPLNLVFVGYEFLGYAGLGPGRQELREIMRGMTSPSQIGLHLVGWLILTAAYATVAAAAFKSWLTRSECAAGEPSLRFWVLCALVPLLSAVLLFCLASVVGFPFWGRHLAGTLPFAVTALAVTFFWAARGLWRRAGRMGCLVAVLALVVSSALIRFAPMHRHDDYKQAASFARDLASRGKTVWWVADHSGGAYYGLAYDEENLVYAMNKGSVPRQPPNFIVMSRPENFDAHGTADGLLRKERYESVVSFKAFEVWGHPEK